MNFHLSFSIPPFTEKIKYSQKLLFMGSCFAENIGELMQHYKFDALTNPGGILYNPLSISATLNRIIENKVLNENELFFANDCWNSWEHHSRFSNMDKQACLTTINNGISSASTFLKQTNWLFITFGSAFVYTHNAIGKIVGNCHKIPQKEFTKQLLSSNEIVDTYNNLFKQLKNVNPHLKIIFTISPVRYVRDGLVENNLSKARIIEAVHQLVKENDNALYFPAYELVIDDLRDYRFYKSDLVHPNEQSIEYVFEKLKDVAFGEETLVLFEKIRNIINAKNHKPFNSASQAHKKFKETHLNLCKQLLKQHPYLHLKEELELFGK